MSSKTWIVLNQYALGGLMRLVPEGFGLQVLGNCKGGKTCRPVLPLWQVPKSSDYHCKICKAGSEFLSFRGSLRGWTATKPPVPSNILESYWTCLGYQCAVLHWTQWDYMGLYYLNHSYHSESISGHGLVQILASEETAQALGCRPETYWPRIGGPRSAWVPSIIRTMMRLCLLIWYNIYIY